MDPGRRQATNRPEPHKLLSTKVSSKEDRLHKHSRGKAQTSFTQTEKKQTPGGRERAREREKKKKLKTKIQNIWIVIGRTNMDDKYLIRLNRFTEAETDYLKYNVKAKR